MCMWFGYDLQINFVAFFPHFELSQLEYNQREQIVGTLCVQLLLQFYADLVWRYAYALDLILRWIGVTFPAFLT